MFLLLPSFEDPATGENETLPLYFDTGDGRCELGFMNALHLWNCSGYFCLNELRSKRDAIADLQRRKKQIVPK